MPRGQVDYSEKGLSTIISKLHIGTKKEFQQKFVHQETYKPLISAKVLVVSVLNNVHD